ncbi:uncharacterized protein LOC128233711 [Mya arenaria]|uniref:uncharacterized protein LOC128233711 n=1 Tax=Mya arenaria TaxID=6604 RepID=UPI0022E342E4|nr:uncharacterized protein LOC128233711 [Mya arenaria]
MFALNCLIYCVIIGSVNCHFKLRKDIKSLQSITDQLTEVEGILKIQFNSTRDNLTNMINNALKEDSDSNEDDELSSEGLERRLANLERRIASIIQKVMAGKEKEGKLRQSTAAVIDEMADKVVSTDAFIVKLKTDIEDQLTTFDNRIQKANKTAHVKISSMGGLRYGGIGTPCSSDSGECVTPESECRADKCQCHLGLSYSHGEGTCVPSCDEYGSTYQTSPNRIIRGYNDLHLNETSLAQCSTRCSTEEAFVCRSFDYFPDWRQCYLSRHVNTDVDESAWEYNGAGYHFQRDCV